MGIGTVISSAISLVLAIAVVIGLAFGALLLLRKFQERSLGLAGEDSGVRSMRFLRALPLGQSERLVLVEVGDEVLLLGVAAHSINMLARWDRAQIDVEDALGEGMPAPRGATAARPLADMWRGVPKFGASKIEG